MPNIFNNPHAKQGEVKLTKEFKRQQFLSKLTSVLGVATIGVISIGIIFSLVKNPIKTSDGFIIPAEPRRYEVGERVHAIEDNKGLNKIKYFIIEQEVLSGEVLAGPFGKIEELSESKYKISDAGNSVIVNAPEGIDLNFLNEQYIVDVNGKGVMILNTDDILSAIIETN